MADERKRDRVFDWIFAGGVVAMIGILIHAAYEIGKLASHR